MPPPPEERVVPAPAGTDSAETPVGSVLVCRQSPRRVSVWVPVTWKSSRETEEKLLVERLVVLSSVESGRPVWLRKPRKRLAESGCKPSRVSDAGEAVSSDWRPSSRSRPCAERKLNALFRTNGPPKPAEI